MLTSFHDVIVPSTIDVKQPIKHVESDSIPVGMIEMNLTYSPASAQPLTELLSHFWNVFPGKMFNLWICLPIQEFTDPDWERMLSVFTNGFMRDQNKA